MGALITCAFLCAGCSGPFSTLDPAGPSASYAAGLWWAMAVFASVVLLVVVALWLYAQHRRPVSYSPDEVKRINRRWLVVGGLILPLSSIALLLTFGIPLGHRMLPLSPTDGEVVRIQVTGHQWWWQVTYPDTPIELRDKVYIPAGVPIDLHLTSNDVVHSFWVPRLGGKLDMIPGRTNILRLQADEPGDYRGQCAEFCGLNHAHMQFVVHTLVPDEFARWLEEASRE